ncbi:hypothetical protein CMV_022360 [Castanea mollissima]|uniref:Uncharacterized protein n=1 Tax=Castanea mollissima TaxID=60419 RepID=A0A8J4VKC2_9ROSI|nr:hypothetical protein CMV_022360 [Castanea mollissima]
MAKKKSWFNIVKRFFIRETNSKQEKDRRRKWIFGGLKIKRSASLTAPSSLNEIILVASEVFQFTSTPRYDHQCVNEVEEFSVIRVQGEAPQSNHNVQGKLSGLRRELEQLQNWKDNITRTDSNNQRRWDDSVLSKEKADALFMSRSQKIRIENSKWKMEAGPMGRRELEYLDLALTSNLRQKDDNRRKQLKLRNVKGHSKLEGLDSPTFVPRGSIHHRKGNAHWETIILCQARLFFQLT